MNREQEFMKDQVKQIEVDKWIEGTKINKDPGDEYVKKWIDDNAKDFRRKWEQEHVEE